MLLLLVPMVLWCSVGAFGDFGKKVNFGSVEALEKANVELTCLPNIETWGTVPFEHTDAPLLCCKPVQQKRAKNRQNPHHSLEPN
jgi:hypothetical protein